MKEAVRDQAVTAGCLGLLMASALVSTADEHATGRGLAKTSYRKLEAGVALGQSIDIKDIAAEVAVEAGLPGAEVNAKLKGDTGFRVDVGGGYNFSDSAALEFEFGVVYNSLKELEVTGMGIQASSEFEQWDLDVKLLQVPFLANLIYRAPFAKFKPYIGGGGGGVFSLIYIRGGSDEFEVAMAPAFQGLAGVECITDENTSIGIGYKLLLTMEQDFNGALTTDDFTTHSFVAAFNYRF